ncbi:sulfotransferase domain-containing protein [Azospirillum sp. B4]|uniref:sulfotransferase domain-containing protein n=1 Tax=Azospirillum sp. B4 TaxID=95605 RepID=UPI0005CAF802|nr:sulfotransferase domain-containing protein [Azospirillum sp. B4]
MHPNLFVLGAGKCGTTSLYHLLERHSDIHVCVPKEPSFFCRQFQVVKNPIDYFKLFDSNLKYRVDSSHVYFSNPETAPVLRDLFPEAKFLVILRQPKARSYSLYQHMRRHYHEDGHPLELIDSFVEALRLEGERFQSPDFLSMCRHYFWNFMYMRSSQYDEQLARYFEIFQRERFLVMTLAEFERSPALIIRAIADFLDIDPDGFGRQVPITNVAPSYSPFDSECDALMGAHFGNLTARVDQLVGRPLDWSR